MNKKGGALFEYDAKSTVIRYQQRKKSHMAFIRLRINEVTSHFPNSWVFLVVQTQDTSVAVKPLVIPMVRVWAKKNQTQVSF